MDVLQLVRFLCLLLIILLVLLLIFFIVLDLTVISMNYLILTIVCLHVFSVQLNYYFGGSRSALQLQQPRCGRVAMNPTW